MREREGESEREREISFQILPTSLSLFVQLFLMPHTERISIAVLP